MKEMEYDKVLQHCLCALLDPSRCSHHHVLWLWWNTWLKPSAGKWSVNEIRWCIRRIFLFLSPFRQPKEIWFLPYISAPADICDMRWLCSSLTWFLINTWTWLLCSPWWGPLKSPLGRKLKQVTINSLAACLMKIV